MSNKQTNQKAALSFSSQQQTYFCRGNWTIASIASVAHFISAVELPATNKIIIDGEKLHSLDTSGAWELLKLQKKFQQHNITFQLEHFTEEQLTLINLVRSYSENYAVPAVAEKLNWFARLGERTVNQVKQMLDFFAYLGEFTDTVGRALAKPLSLPWRALCNVIETSGYQALFIIALLSLMIGVVLTYQMGLQLRTYGANIYIVDLLGLAILREFASLLTAIIVAGRTGSAFTAQLGTMKINEEIDALRSMGIAPAKLLIFPKIAGLVVVLPLLTIWADIFGIIGGMVMSKIMLNVTFYDFLNRFQRVISVNSFWIGIAKSPIFASLIASIGCFQGMQVENGADSVGRQTTKSVVQAIFAIIVADAFFSILFSKFGI